MARRQPRPAPALTPETPVIKGEYEGLPSVPGMSAGLSPEAYADNLALIFKGAPLSAGESLGELIKAISAPPSMMSYARISYMPEMHNPGVMQWPGIPPEALKKVAKENLAPQLIINMRVADVLRYSQLSNQPWKPGWKIYPRFEKDKPSKATLKEIREAERFIANCNIETGWDKARERDKLGLTGIQRFLAMIVRDTFTYDGIAIWTDMDRLGRVKAYKALHAGQIRLTGPNGYHRPHGHTEGGIFDGAEGIKPNDNKPEKDIFAVGVDDAGNVIETFTRDELVWYVRNPRSDPGVFGYGYSETEVGMRLIQGFTNALDLNIDAFNRNSVPNGMLLLTGKGWNQRQLDVIARLWTNLKSGTTKSWALPAMQVPQDGKVEILDLTDIKGKEVYYQDFLNMVVGAFCTLFCFPVTRLGYRISGKGPDSKPDGAAAEWIVDDNDPGLAPLLHHLEAVFNEYLLWTRWPELEFCFTGKSPKEDAREYELRSLAMTVDERRKQAGLPPLADDAPSHMKDLATLMGMATTDPALSGIFQSMAATFLGGGAGAGGDNTEKNGALFPSKKDPAASEEHGHTSGVRRHNEAPAPKKPTA